jgi:hypothetical protein
MRGEFWNDFFFAVGGDFGLLRRFVSFEVVQSINFLL